MSIKAVECEWCGEAFESVIDSEQYFCSFECSRRWLYANDFLPYR